MEMLEIDGSRGEGGGQMVRTSVAMSTVTGIPVHLTRIRENRPTNGLSKQHVAAVRAVAQMAGSEIEGCTMGSGDLLFYPGTEQVYDIDVNISSAGSISLVLQAMLLAARNHTRRLTVDINGGTNVMWAPPIDSYSSLLFPMMGRMGITADVKVIERGFYPQGGGRVIATLDPIGDIRPLRLDTLGELKRIRGVCFCQRLADWIPEAMVKSCDQVFSSIADVEIETQYTDGDSRGAGLVLVAEYENGMLGSNALSARGQSPERSGRDAAKDLLNEMRSGATMDVHTADQLLPYMAMAQGESSFNVSRISRHLLSQMDTLESFLDVKFGVERVNDVYRFTVTPGVRQ
ncbi:MAG: RNA 3'-terminal phosphate cyclase [Thermoplasmata archaeon]|nr:RNA 3'-terminal phosphate cyclase [Thermoplasmata archaeon]